MADPESIPISVKPPASPRELAAWLSIPPAVVAVLAMLPVLGNGFVGWDDLRNFLENGHYKGLGWAQLRWAWTTEHLGVYQPLSWMLLEAEYAAWGLRPAGYHLVSLLLHAVVAAVLAALAFSVLRRTRPGSAAEEARSLAAGSGLAAALFAAHPLRVEVIAWASCQPYLPCALFSLLSVLAYLKSRPENGSGPGRRGWLIAAMLLYASALLSKAAATTLPAVLLLLDVYPLRRLGGGLGGWFGRRAWAVWLEKLPFAALGVLAAVAAVHAKAVDRTLQPLAGHGASSRLAQAGYGAWFYLAKTVWPTGLSAYYPLPHDLGLDRPVYLAAVLGLVAASVAALRLGRRWPGLPVAWFAYLALLAPSLGLLRVGHQLAADRYAYLATMPLALVLAYGVSQAASSGPRRKALATLVAALIVGLGALSWRQCRTWHDSEALWANAWAQGAKGDPTVANNLGAAYLERGDVERARAQFAGGIRDEVGPPNATLRANLGRALTLEGRLDEAMAAFREALRIEPGTDAAWVGLGQLLVRRGRLDEALAVQRRAVQLRPDSVAAHVQLGTVLTRQGRLEEATAEFAEALRINPDSADAHNNLGMARLNQGRSDLALAEFREAIRLNPALAEAHSNLATVLLDRAALAGARGQYLEALKLKPDLPDAHTGLGLVLARQGRPAEAAEHFARALRINPGHPIARRALQQIQGRQASPESPP